MKAHRILYLLLVTFELLTCVHSQGAGDVWFSLRNTTYQNNSIVALEDIGEDGDALLCVTNLTACCQSPANGNWFFPNGTRVPSLGHQWDFYRTRGQMVVHLHRRRAGMEGIYRCEIPDTMNVNQTIYIIVVSISNGADDVWFSLRDTTYQNNSNVTLEDIGEGSDALHCMTNLTTCCHRSVGGENVRGNWFFPNGTRVPSSGVQWDFYRTRGHMVVRVQRRRGGAEGVYRCEIPDTFGLIQTLYIEVYSASTGSPMITPPYTPEESTSQVTGTSPPSSSPQPTNTPQSDEPTTVPVTSITPQPTNIPPSDGATTILVIIVVTFVIVLLIIIVGVVILVVLCNAKKKKKQQYNVPTENEDIELKLKQEGTTEDLSTDQPLYAVVEKETAPTVPKKSDELVNYLNRNSIFTGEYSETAPKLIPADSEYTLPSSPSKLANISHTMFGKMESNPMYQSMDKYCESPSYTNVPEGTMSDDIYTMPDIANPHTVEAHNEAVYSEPLQPSLFTGAVVSSNDSEDLQPYGPIYSDPTALPKSDEMPLEVFANNIQEVHQIGIGLFGKVILAKTVGLSPKDLKMSKTDDDKSKSTLVAVKTLKSGAPSTTKEAFEKEVNFMSRLNDKNVIRILGVCREDTPFIMMEYMEKGDLNRYLRKFQVLGTTDSEPQGQITTSTLVHITTQIASAMKYLALHNYVHRDLATRNCLVGPNYLVKISDFGMSRNLYESHYYCIQGRAVLPVRWMSVECFYGKFSQKSDVWAFGITTWEIFTLAKEHPYNDWSDKQVVEDAIKGKDRKLLAKPDICPPEVYDIMLKCWVHNMKQRATFEELFQMLSTIHSDQI